MANWWETPVNPTATPWMYRPPEKKFVKQPSPRTQLPKDSKARVKDTVPEDKQGGKGFINPSTGMYTTYSDSKANIARQERAAEREAKNAKSKAEEKKNRSIMAESQRKFTAAGGWGMGTENVEKEAAKRDQLPTMNTGTGHIGGSIRKRKKQKFREINEERQLTDKEFRKLPKDKQDLIRFNTIFQEARSSKDKKKLSELYLAMNQTRGQTPRDAKGEQIGAGYGATTNYGDFISEENFRRGMGALTEEDLFGKADAPIKRRPASAPYFEQFGQQQAPHVGPRGNPIIQPTARMNQGIDDPERQKLMDEQSYKMEYGGEARKRLIALIVNNVGDYMKRYDRGEAEKAKLDTALARRAEEKRNAEAAPNAPDIPLGLAQAVGIDENQEKVILQKLAEITKPSLWKMKGASSEAIYDAMESQYKIPREKFAEYTGRLLEHREKYGKPLNGTPGDVFSAGDYLKHMGIKVQNVDLPSGGAQGGKAGADVGKKVK